MKVASTCNVCLLRSPSKWWSLEIVRENGFWVAVDWSFEIFSNFRSDLKVTYSWGVTLPRYFVSFKWYFQTSIFLCFLYEIFSIFPDVKIFSKYKALLFFRRMSHVSWFMFESSVLRWRRFIYKAKVIIRYLEIFPSLSRLNTVWKNTTLII